MFTQNLTQRGMQQVGSRMMIADFVAAGFINLRFHRLAGRLRKRIGNMQDQVIFADGIGYRDSICTNGQGTGISNLPSALSIEGRLIQNQLIDMTVGGFYPAVFYDPGRSGAFFIAGKNAGFIKQIDPVASLHIRGRPAAFFLLFHFPGKTGFINR